MIRTTSVEAYRFVKECGYVGRRQIEIYEILIKYGPKTSGEVFEVLLSNQRVSKALNQTRARFTELREMGMIEEVGRRPCNITGRMAIVWASTNNMPTKIVKKIKIKCQSCKGIGYLL